MAKKVPPTGNSKKQGKSLMEKRALKRAKKAEGSRHRVV
jgi:hypothetical protein